jgi:hypothetical protein
MPNPPPETKPARLLSVVIPARNEEGSTDSTWQILQREAAKIPALEQSLDHCPRAAHSRDLPIHAMELGIVH